MGITTFATDHPLAAKVGGANPIPAASPTFGPFAVGTRFLALGDSRTANAFSSSGTIMENLKWPDRLMSASRGRLVLLPGDDFGVGGDTTAMMLARIAPVKASTAEIACILAGTNDRGSANFTLEQTQDNIVAIIDALTASGKTVVIMSETPRIDGSALGATQDSYHTAFHAWVMRYLATYPGVLVADVWKRIGSSDLSDGLHPRTQGAMKIGEAFWTALAPYMSSDELLPLASGNLVTSPAMDGGTSGTKSGTGVTGTVATGFRYTISATNQGTLAAVCSITTTGGKTWQQVTLSGLPTGTNTPELRAWPSAADILLAGVGLAIGDTVEAMVEFSVDTAANLPGMTLRLRGLQSDASTATFTVEHGDYDSSDVASLVHDSFTGVLRTPPIVIPALTDRLRLTVINQVIALPVAATWRVTNATLRKVT